MTCQEYWNTMPELAGAGEETAAHGQECAACAAALRNHGALAAGLRGVAAEWGRLKAPGRVEARLLAAFRGQAGLASLPPARRWWSPLLAWVTAGVVVGAAFLLFSGRARQPQTPLHTPAGMEAAATDWSAVLPADVTGDAAAGDFIPLPNADRLPQDEDMNVVRVEVPRSAMIALGYSVPADRASERVRADVVMGSDGLARAVRFLDE
jgi:hypothetical protein